MAKVLTFSQTFPADHPRAGAKTGFPAKILSGLMVDPSTPEYFDFLCGLNRANLDAKKFNKFDLKNWINGVAMETPQADKIHTIRGAERFVPGELASPRVWMNKPYKSPQIIFWEPVPIKQVLPFEIRNEQEVFIDHKFYCFVYDIDKMYPLSTNDGLSLWDFLNWFKYPAPVLNMEILAWGSVKY